MSELIMIPVKTESDVETLRQIRNVCKNFMTRHTDEITYEQQQNWYKNIDKDTNKLYLLHKN
jgi:hypothetical protein